MKNKLNDLRIKLCTFFLCIILFFLSSFVLYSCANNNSDRANFSVSKYVQIDAKSDDTIITLNNFGENNPNLLYSYDKSHWNEYTKPLSVLKNNSIYLSGNNNDGWSKNLTDYSSFTIKGNVDISGNIMGLISSDDSEQSSIPSNFCFYKCFYNNIGIINISLDFLPSLILKKHCYQEMFANCSSLISIPKLPSTNLDDYCYMNMFKNCDDLIISSTFSPSITKFFECPILDNLIEPVSGMFANCDFDVKDPIANQTYYFDNSSVVKFFEIRAIENDVNAQVINLYENNPDLYYSYDRIVWIPYEYGGFVVKKGKPVFLKGNNPNGWSHSDIQYSTFRFNGKVNIYGSIMSLISLNENGNIPNEYCFYRCFANDNNINFIDNNFLPAIGLTDFCYMRMFSYCTSLINMPNLPATTLANYCYNEMFIGCVSLTEVNTLPARKLSICCYQKMFEKCSSLKIAPSIEAEVLDNWCCMEMFCDCSSLMMGPTELKAENLVNSCYARMFVNCTSLTNAPLINVKKIGDWSCTNMFLNCTNLNVTTTYNNQLYEFFTCPSLVGVNDPVTNMFSNTGGPYKDLPVAGSTYFCGFVYFKVKSISDDSSQIILKNFGLCHPILFYSYDKINWSKYVKPIELNKNEIIYFNGDNPKGWSHNTSSYSVFSIIGGSVNIEGSIMSLINSKFMVNKIPSDCCFYKFFDNNDTIKNVSYDFLPATELSNYCYYKMFSKCSSLESAPELPATILADYCYWYMFSNCTSLKITDDVKYGKVPFFTLINGADILKVNNMFLNTNTNDKYFPTINFNENTTYYFGWDDDIYPQPKLIEKVINYIKISPIFSYCDVQIINVNNSVNVFYSYDLKSWLTYTHDYKFRVYKNTSLYLCGVNSDGWSISKNNYSTISIEGSSNIDGNMMGLIDPFSLVMDAIPCQYCFYKCFEYSDVSHIVNWSNFLPATQIKEFCYAYMFYHCEQLDNLVALPAKKLAGGCYEYMYAFCLNLSNIASYKNYLCNFDIQKDLAIHPYCLAYMFCGCINLSIDFSQLWKDGFHTTTIYEIPQDELPENWDKNVEGMFKQTRFFPTSDDNNIWTPIKPFYIDDSDDGTPIYDYQIVFVFV